LIETCRESNKVAHVLGAVHGIQGVLGGEIIDLGREDRKTLEAVASTPCSALRSVRKKPNETECRQVLDALEKMNVRWFFYIGGNDSAETANLIEKMARDDRYEMSIFHVPKTIDNDLRVTDHSPGYGSAARFVAHALIGDNEDNRSLPGVKLDVIMGRHAGWLTAASVLARRDEDDGPHLIYVPEVPFELPRFLADVDAVHRRHGRCLVAISEGVHTADGAPIGAGKDKDSFGNVQLSGSGALGDWLVEQVKSGLGAKLRVRADTFGYLQRSFPGLASKTDAAEAREVGRVAARAALKGKHPSGTVAILRKDKREYDVRYEIVELALVAGGTRSLDPRYVLGTNDIAPEFLDYVRPLAGKLPKAKHLSDHPFDSAEASTS
jgi:6-phosphofructokinase 1